MINILCSVVACLNVILYDAEQLLSQGHAELIHHLYNAQMLLDEYLRESLHNEYSISYTQTVNSHLQDLKLTNMITYYLQKTV